MVTALYAIYSRITAHLARFSSHQATPQQQNRLRRWWS